MLRLRSTDRPVFGHSSHSQTSSFAQNNFAYDTSHIQFFASSPRAHGLFPALCYSTPWPPRVQAPCHPLPQTPNNTTSSFVCTVRPNATSTATTDPQYPINTYRLVFLRRLPCNLETPSPPTNNKNSPPPHHPIPRHTSNNSQHLPPTIPPPPHLHQLNSPPPHPQQLSGQRGPGTSERTPVPLPGPPGEDQNRPGSPRGRQDQPRRGGRQLEEDSRGEQAFGFKRKGRVYRTGGAMRHVHGQREKEGGWGSGLSEELLVLCWCLV